MIASSAALVLAVACEQAEPAKIASNMPRAKSRLDAPAPVQSTPMIAQPVARPTSADEPREGPAAGNTEAQPAMQLSDGEILEITHAANAGEVDQAKIALSKTTDSRVKSLAQMIMRDHTQADNKGMVVGKKAGIKRQTSPVSQSLESDVDSATVASHLQHARDLLTQLQK
jgi:hypothetical protein